MEDEPKIEEGETKETPTEPTTEPTSVETTEGEVPAQ